MKTIKLFGLAACAAVFSHSAGAAITQFTNYNIVSNSPYMPVPSRFTDFTTNLNMVVNELSTMPLGGINSGDTINGITYAFNIFNRTDPNSANATTAQVVSNSWSGFRPVLTPPGDGTAFQPGGLSRNDSVTLTFSTPITAFGVGINLALNSTFNISTDVDGVSAGTNGISFYGDLDGSFQTPFLGLISDTPFSSVTLSGGNRYAGSGGRYGGGSVTPWSGWDITRITYNEVTAVPVPASWLLFLSGLAWGARRLTVFAVRHDKVC